MKRFLLIFFALALAFPVTALAAGETAETATYTADAAVDEDALTEQPPEDGGPRLSDGAAGSGKIESPSDYWGMNGYPEDVSYACNAGGEMEEDGAILQYWEIGLVDATGARKEEITAMFADTCLITYFEAKYSYAERAAALTEIETEVKDTRDGNFVQGLLITNSDKVYVVVKDGVRAEYAEKYAKRYGDMVWVDGESEQGFATDSTMTGDIDGGMGEIGEAGNKWYIAAILFVVLAAMTALYFTKIRKAPAMETADGTVVTGGKPLTRAETAEAVRASEKTPDDGVFDKIKGKIE